MRTTSAQLRFLLSLSRSQNIARRYFVTNGFDGALTLFGLIMGFYSNANPITSEVVLNACLGVTIALGVSGTTSAYISETAERQKTLRELERAMVADLTDTAHDHAGILAALLIAFVNGLAPVLMAMIIIIPLLLDTIWHIRLPVTPLEAALVSALLSIFLLGVYIGKISGMFWFWAGLRTALIALATSSIIMLFVS